MGKQRISGGEARVRLSQVGWNAATVDLPLLILADGQKAGSYLVCPPCTYSSYFLTSLTLSGSRATNFTEKGEDLPGGILMTFVKLSWTPSGLPFLSYRMAITVTNSAGYFPAFFYLPMIE